MRCSILLHALAQDAPHGLGLETAKLISMDLDRTRNPGNCRSAAERRARVWLESVSAGMRTVEAVIRELSQNDVPVLVVAEHGSGKAAAAARIHALSSRAAEPFQVYQGREASAEILAACEGQVEPSIFRKWETSRLRPRRNWFARSV